MSQGRLIQLIAIQPPLRHELIHERLEPFIVVALKQIDVEFPEVARTLAQAGADLLVTISANMEPFGPDHRVFSTARALENGLPHASLADAGSAGKAVLDLKLQLSGNSSVRPDYLGQLRSPFPVVARE